MDHERPVVQIEAQRDFSKARTKAFWQEIWGLMTGKNTELMRFEDVQRSLGLQNQRYLGLQDIPIANIIGTVGRYNDFNRKFLPRKTVNQERWKRISALARGSLGFPPIEVYKVGDAYFVIDGNHRVSVAIQMGQSTIEAYVTELPTSVPFDANTTPDELSLKQEYAEFLKETQLSHLRPGSNLMLTESGLYPQILQHINVHRYFMGIEQDHDILWEDAVVSWYDNVYMPMIQAIREYGILNEFPNRTETDLYVWLIHHQAAIHDNYGGNWLSAEETARDFKSKLD